MEKSNVHVENLLKQVSDENINLANQSTMLGESNQATWAWSATESQSWNNQSWSSQSWNK